MKLLQRPSKARKRLYNRSGFAKCPVTGTYVKLVEHHIKGRNIPNPNHPSNIVWLSPNAHDAVHSGDIIIEGWVMTSNGLELCWKKKNLKT